MTENKYQLLISTLDSLINEAPDESTKYDTSTEEKTNQARSRALIQLFLRTRFGICNFTDAEKFITDGSNDGGLDAYYIDQESKVIYLIQSKFRTNQTNFETQPIHGYDLFKMELGLIVRDGKEKDSQGNRFNGKILGLQREIKDIGGQIGRYKYRLIFLGNIPENLDPNQLNTVSGNICDEVEIINGKDTYSQLLLPYLQSDFYNKKEFVLKIKINQNQSNRINYSVKINNQPININISFIPTLEVAKMMNEYKNSLLKYNPRCYVGIKKGGVNLQINKSISETDSNEFSLLNNGITVICNEFEYSERNAEPNSATLIITNPQIVNGGQTAFTLSKILAEGKSEVFDNKEVLVKFISLNQDQTPNQVELIEKISEATNNQTPVYLSDRKSNDDKLIDLQNYLFENHGYLLERKKGEFYDAISKNIISKDRIVTKEHIMRLILVLNKKLSEARGYASEKLFEIYPISSVDPGDFIKIFNLISIYKTVSDLEQSSSKQEIKYRIKEFGSGLRYGKYSMVGAIFYMSQKRELDTAINTIKSKWLDFEATAQNLEHNKDYNEDGFNFANYYRGKTINKDLFEYLDSLSESMN
jgi:hypothetical protein